MKQFLIYTLVIFCSKCFLAFADEINTKNKKSEVGLINNDNDNETKTNWYKETSWDSIRNKSVAQANTLKAKYQSKLETSFTKPTSLRQPVVDKANETNLTEAISHIRVGFQKATMEDLDSILVATKNTDDEDRRTQTRDVDDFEPIRINFITNSLEDENFGSLQPRVDYILNSVLPAAKDFYSRLLKVKPYVGSISISEEVCSNMIEDIPNDLLRRGLSNSDLGIFVQGQSCGSSTIAAGSVCSLSKYDYRPAIGILLFCLDSPALSDDSDDAVDVTVHEIAHILGMNSDVFPFFLNPETGNTYLSNPTDNVKRTLCTGGEWRDVLHPSNKIIQQGVTGQGAVYFDVITPTVQTVTRNQFNCQSLNGARLENQPTADECFGSHWDERLFYTEQMSAFYESEESSFSAVTLALFEDSGWYIGDYSLTSKSTFGHGAGCDFVEKDCIINGELPPHSKGFFCNMPSSFTQQIMSYQCTPSHQSIGYCDLFNYMDEGLSYSVFPPPEFRYYGSVPQSAVFFDRADYCPIALALDDAYCGSDPNGLCINLELNGFTGAQCAQYVCNNDLKKLQISTHFSDEVFTCNSDFEKFEHPEYTGAFIECPRLAVMCPDFVCPLNCSGKGVCNYNRSPPRCECFDSNDKSSSCDGSPPEPETTFTFPLKAPTKSPTAAPSPSPTKNPTNSPTKNPTNSPTKNPTNSPTKNPTSSPTKNPTTSPTNTPFATSLATKLPTTTPTNSVSNKEDTNDETNVPTATPTKEAPKFPIFFPQP